MKKIDEVAQPVGGDEKAFKAKHKVAVKDHPEGIKLPPVTTQKKKRLADYDTGQDEVAYEETETFYSVTWRDGNGMDKRQDGLTEDKAERLLTVLETVGASLVSVYEMTDAQMKKREEYVKGMKAKGQDLRNRYGKKWKDVMYAIATKNAMKEELTGSQHKIDVNKNGKVDAHDFKLLRAKKKVKEEVEELDEISAKTLGSYSVKATQQIAKGAGSKENNRYAGVKMADEKARKKEGYSSSAKIAAEEVEQIDEELDFIIEMEDAEFESYIETLDEEQLAALDEGLFKTAAKVGKAIINRFSTSGRADAAEKKLKKIQKKNTDIQRLRKAKAGLSAANRRSTLLKAGRNPDVKKPPRGSLSPKPRVSVKAATSSSSSGGGMYGTLSKEEVEQIDEVGGNSTQKPISHPPTRPLAKSVEKKTTTVKEAGDVNPPNYPKMKSSEGGKNNFSLKKTRPETFNVPTEKDRALEMDEAAVLNKSNNFGAKKQPVVRFSYDMPDGRTGLGTHKVGEKIDKKKFPGYSVAKEESETSTRAFELIQKLKQMQEEKLKEQIEKEIIETEVELTEVFKPGNLKLNDGNVILVTKEQAEPLNKLFHSLSDKNKKVMEDKLMKSRDSFSEILKFAKETM